MSLLAALVCAGWIAPSRAPAQLVTSGMKINGFSLPDYYDPPNQNQMKSLLTSAQAQALSDGRLDLRNARLERFTTNGTRELTIAVADCLYDPQQRTASSTGAIQVATGDGRLLTSGEGFLWRQTNATLIISNRVHTTVWPDGTNSVTSSTNRRVEIDAQQTSLDWAARVATYFGNVEARDFTGEEQPARLNSGRLRIQLADANQVDNLLAEEDVVFQQGPLSAAGDRGRYLAKDGVVEISGHGRWQQDARSGRGDTLLFHRKGRSFRADGNVFVRLPGDTVGLPELDSFEAPTTSQLAPTTNRFVEIRCDLFANQTNQARFNGHVRAALTEDGQVRGTLDCATLSTIQSTNDALEKLIAETDVTLTEGARQLHGERLVYVPADGLAEVTGHPTWTTSEQEGKAQWLGLDLRRHALVARTNAWLQMRLRTVGAGSFVLPNVTVNPGSPDAGPQTLNVECAEYTLTPAMAAFRGDVNGRVLAGDRLRERLTGGQWDVSINPTNRRIEQVAGRQDVQIEQMEDPTNATPHVAQWLRAPQFTATLNPANGQVETMLAETNAVFHVRNQKGRAVSGASEQIAYHYTVNATQTNALVEFIGHPWLTNETGVATGPLITYDLLTGQVTGISSGASAPAEGAMPTNPPPAVAPAPLERRPIP